MVITLARLASPAGRLFFAVKFLLEFEFELALEEFFLEIIGPLVTSIFFSGGLDKIISLGFEDEDETKRGEPACPAGR